MATEAECVTNGVCHIFFTIFPINDIYIRVYRRVIIEVIYCWRNDAIA